MSYFYSDAISLRLALPQCPELEQIKTQLLTCGFELPDLDQPGIHLIKDPIGLGIDFEIFKMAASDVGVYVEHGISHLGISSTELLHEADARLWRPFTFSYGTYPLVLAAPQGINLELLERRQQVRIATSLPRHTREIFAARGMNIDVVPVQDSTTACLLGLADAYVERMSDPQTLIRQGFRVLEVLGHARLKLVVNRGSYTMRRSAIDTFMQLLYDCLPPTPTPLDIPFDLED